MSTARQLTMPALETIIASVASEHADTLGVDASTITSQRADAAMQSAGVTTTTELLLLLARFHADVDDKAGSDMLAAFAVTFAALECKVV